MGKVDDPRPVALTWGGAGVSIIPHTPPHTYPTPRPILNIRLIKDRQDVERSNRYVAQSHNYTFLPVARLRTVVLNRSPTTRKPSAVRALEKQFVSTLLEALYRDHHALAPGAAQVFAALRPSYQPPIDLARLDDWRDDEGEWSEDVIKIANLNYFLPMSEIQSCLTVSQNLGLPITSLNQRVSTT